MVKPLLITIMLLLGLSQTALADHCTKSNPAGGSIPVDCVHPERGKIDAPGPIESKLPGVNQTEIDSILELMEKSEKQQIKPVHPAR